MKRHEIKIIRENSVYENQYGKLLDDDVLFLPQNVKGTYVRWKWNTPYSIGVLPVLTSTDVVLIESFRHAARKSVIEIPKGFGENMISPEKMAKRELAEEAGLKSDNWEYIGDVLTDTSFTYHPMKLFIAWNCNEVHDNHEDSEVIIAKHIYPMSSIPAVISKLEIYDVVSLFVLMLAYQRRK